MERCASTSPCARAATEARSGHARMGFLTPAFLLGALAVALPLYLHLLRRRRASARPFSSLMLFEPRPQGALRRRRLRYWPLLALRLAVVLLLALAFAEPYVQRFGTAVSAPSRLLIAIDDSFSMRAAGRLAAAQREALALLARRPASQAAQVLLLGAQVRLLTPPTHDERALRAAVRSIVPSDAHASLGALAAALRTLAGGEPHIELHLFSDLQQSSLPPSFNELAMPAGVQLVLHSQGAALPNWTVESVSAPGQLWDARRLHVQAVIAGFATPAATRTASLVVNGRTLATRAVAVPADGRAVVDFDGIELPHGASRCAVRIDAADALPEDDEYRFALERADPRRGLLIHELSDERSPRYLGAALQAASEPALQLEQSTPERAGALDLSAYAFVILADLAALPPALESRLEAYVRAGGGVLVGLGTTAAQQQRVPLLGSALEGVHAYAREPSHFAVLGAADPAYPVLGGEVQPWERVKFYYTAVLDPLDAHVALRLADGTPLLIDEALGEGRLILFASGFDNLTNDLPLHPLFVAFIDRAVRYLAGLQLRPSARRVGDVVPLRSSRERGVSVAVIDPRGERPLSLAEATTATSLALEQAGFYELQLANGRRELIAVNSDRRESDLRPIPEEVLALWRATGAPAASLAAGSPPPAGSPPAAAARVHVAQGLWWYAIALLLVAALAEAGLASRYLGTRREQS